MKYRLDYHKKINVFLKTWYVVKNEIITYISISFIIFLSLKVKFLILQENKSKGRKRHIPFIFSLIFIL